MLLPVAGTLVRSEQLVHNLVHLGSRSRMLHLGVAQVPVDSSYIASRYRRQRF